MDAREKYEALQVRNADRALRNRKEEMEALKEAYDELGHEINGVLTPFIDQKGREVLDPTPIAPPVGFVERESIVDRVRAMIAGNNFQRLADLKEMDTFEEADDFDVDDDPIPMRDTPYENEFDPPVRELVTEGSRSLASKAAKKAKEDAEAAKASGSPNNPAPPPPAPPKP